MSDRDFHVSEIRKGTPLCGRYRVEALLAEGATASVYRARDERLGETVALKVLDPLRGADPVGRARFERELTILGRLDHRGVCRCLRLEREGDLEILVLEHLEGDSLSTRLAHGRLPLDEALTIAADLADALRACHARDVLHRDLKPENVVLVAGRGAVVLDFGVAWFGAAANLTRTGAMIGSPQYMAPEIFASSLADARSDLYSLGAILFEMLTGRPVRLVDSIAELAAAHLRTAPPSVSAFRSDAGAEIDRLVARAIATYPEDRFATAAELGDAIRRRHAGSQALKTSTACRGCGTHLVIDLPFCAGCGRETSWALSRGPYAVQIVGVGRPSLAVEWLTRRHGRNLRLPTRLLTRRLARAPIPLAIGVSQSTAEQLVAEAKDAGCGSEMLHARTLLGPSLAASAATFEEIVAALLLHLGVVVAYALLLRLVGASGAWFALAPFVVACVGIVAASAYVRRPLLVAARSTTREAVADPTGLRKKLASLRTDRARRLASGAVGRATRALLDDAADVSTTARTDALAAMHEAVDAAVDVDRHAAFLTARPRSRLAAEIIQARTRIDAGDDDAIEKLVTLEQEKRALFDASVAHDLSVRLALESSAAISVALSRGEGVRGLRRDRSTTR